ncbi:ACR3 family arsenite efflux transporter [Candidatus Lokiarchaeum ossiferum]|uniref:ACR3 family arsenite efflux transporter n=1 Tax=Candidatus Lokiarchaeum ossiferum TaxID=2951803 RepID=UPI00352CEBF7
MVEQAEGKKISFFEKFLAVWVALCILAGILLSVTIPGIGETLNSWQIRGISIPIGVCLFLMMYPAMLNLQVAELKKLKDNPKPIILTLVSNWIVAPLVGALLAWIFVRDQPQLIVAVILLCSSPCTAMVLVWGSMAEGNQEQNVVNTSLNTVTIIFLYAPVVALLTGIQNIQIDRGLLIISVVVFIGLPLIIGVVSKKLIIKNKGEDWFHNIYRPAIGKISIFALLTTLIILFSLNGTVLLENPELLWQVSIPLLIGFVIVVGYNLLITKLFKLKYRQAIISVIIGSSSHFEIAIATAVAMYGVGSIAALGTTMGLFWEVPIMLGLVYLGKFLRKKNFWESEE